MSSKRDNKLSIKQLESYLQDLDGFENPIVELEQYATPPHIAAVMLNTIDLTYNDINDKFVADLGCGTGRLSIGSLLCGARMVFGFDIDRTALERGLQNISDLFSDESCDSQQFCPLESYKCNERFNFVQADLGLKNSDIFHGTIGKMFDTVIMNPPFGTKHNRGLDIMFLKQAIDMSDVTYSLHKTSTREYILNKCQQWAVSGKPIAQIRYNLDNTYKFHRKKSVDIDVDLWRIKACQGASVLDCKVDLGKVSS